jgi:capsular exopolysaccharide synthesis family protein
MSRIHEALKKAEHERAGQQIGEVVAPPATAGTDAGVRGNGATTSDAAVHARTDVICPALSIENMRFQDLRARCAHPHWDPDPNVNVFLNPETGAQGAEQFRTLRSRLYRLRGNKAPSTLLVTSCIAGEGKTFVANNLAQAIVHQADRRALIIDADLRRARLHLPLGAPLTPGLSEYLRGEVDELAIIQNGNDGNLCLIASGNEVSNPSELLSNGRMKVLLDRVTPIFDWVILDSPPYLSVTDASVLADMCDGVLLVLRAGFTPSDVAQKVRQELQGKNVVGVVFNAVEQSQAYEKHYYSGFGSRK